MIMDDKSHLKLMEDIYSLLRDAEKYEFHDTKSPYKKPKPLLRNRLLIIAKNAMEGVYDNQEEYDCQE